MVMTRPPAFHIWKFLMKNMTSSNSGLKVDLETTKVTHAPSTHHCLNLAQFTSIMSIICDIKSDIHGNIRNYCMAISSQ